MNFPLTIIIAIASVPAVAFADGTADSHLSAGLAKFESGDYELAIEEFRAGFAIEPRPAFLFALGQAERLSGDCASAVSYYEHYLNEEIEDSQRTAAEDLIGMCRRALASRPDGATEPPAPEPESESASEPAVVAKPAPRRVAQPWYRDHAGNALAAASVVSLAIGTVYIVRAGSASDRAATASSYDEHQRLVDEAGGRRTIGLVGFSVGAALGAAALWRYWNADNTRLTVEAGGSGAAVSWTGRF